MTYKLHKAVYIPSIEATDLFSFMNRDKDISLQFVGMIPSSLELNKLISVGLKTTTKKTSEKFLSTDVINVKFKQKADSGRNILTRIKTKIEALEENASEYKRRLLDLSEKIESSLELEQWQEFSGEDLRRKFYNEGFIYNDIKYVVYKRSSAKSRIGQCLFIRSDLYDEMITWSRMGLCMSNSIHKIDYPSLLAYESLVGSSLESVVKISSNNILIINDVESEFIQSCNIIRTGKDGYLDSFTENAQIKNSLFDGESLLDSRYFQNGKSMLLLRNHMFKSAAFNCNIQEYLKDSCPSGVNYDEWSLPNMFGEGDRILAKNVHLIITPSSLKALKFSYVLGTPNDMWSHWKKTIEADNCFFGICKSEKQSKYGLDENNNIIQQTSYQMINSMPLTPEDISKFTKFEKEYIARLKNDDDFFIEFIKDSANDINSNNMFAQLYERNKDVTRTKLFRKFRTEMINSHVTHVKNGKVRLHGDYLVMLGNPMEFLAHSIGKLNLNETTLKGNEVYTSMFPQKEITGFRNPHTSPSNVLVAKNTHRIDIDTYFNLSKNIICVNAISFPIQDILSSCDYDSDTVLMIDDENLLATSKELFGKYRVCINQVSSSKREYAITSNDMATIDNELSKSQKYIGRTVNVGQLCMSTYWDLLSKGTTENELAELLRKVDVVTVLSCICIDMAKKMFEIDIKKEIDYVGKTNGLKKEKPLFWKYVSQNRDVKTIKYNCPMDYLYDEMTAIDHADQRRDLNFKDLLIKGNLKTGDRKQQTKIIDYVEEMCRKINNSYSDSYSEKERDILIEDTLKYYSFYIQKLKINHDTMYALLSKIASYKKSSIASRLLNTLFKTHLNVFLSAFKYKNSTL